MDRVDAHLIEHRERLDPVADLGYAARAVEPAGNHLDTVSPDSVRGRVARRLPRQARSISSALPKRSVGSRRRAREKKP